VRISCTLLACKSRGGKSPVRQRAREGQSGRVEADCPEPIALVAGANELDHAVAGERDIDGSEDEFEAVITELADGEERAIAKVIALREEDGVRGAEQCVLPGCGCRWEA
jgi:hypothetical protein